MKISRADDEVRMAKALELQKRLAWDFERSIGWNQGIDLRRPFVPLDSDALVFPEASGEQRLAISQYVGLVIAQTFAELETALLEIKDLAWKQGLERYPVNPEFEALGEQFFTEEQKHSRAFKRYLRMFAEETDTDYDDLASILPSASGSVFHKALTLNSTVGGHAIWWVLILVEEASILLYKQIEPFEKDIDPLYCELHRRHFEEEARHGSYSYWMIDHFYRRNKSPLHACFRKTDVAFAQAVEILWTFTSLARIRNVHRLKANHSFYATLASCTPLLRTLSPLELTRRLFATAPFVNLLLNPHLHPRYRAAAAKLRAFQIPVPKPQLLPLSA